VAVATDVGAWRVVLPVLRELGRRGTPYRVMLAEPAASIARQDGIEHVVLPGGTAGERANAVLAARPDALLLGTSVQAVVERALIQRVRGRIPTLAILDAMLFVERRFGPNLAELADLVACPDEATACRLRAAGAPATALAVTGNPTLEAIRQVTGAARGEGRPIDVLFVSSPVAAMRLRGAAFTIDEREALADVLATLETLAAQVSDGFRVRVRLHPVQRDEGLSPPPPGVTLVPDDDPDRLRSCARAQVVVGLSSTLLGEARFLPRHAVAYLPGPFWEHEHVFAPEYGVRLAGSREQLQRLLARALAEPPDPSPLAGHIGAAGRIADLLPSLALHPD
jgi:hypothetical protein